MHGLFQLLALYTDTIKAHFSQMKDANSLFYSKINNVEINKMNKHNKAISPQYIYKVRSNKVSTIIIISIKIKKNGEMNKGTII